MLVNFDSRTDVPKQASGRKAEVGGAGSGERERAED